MNDTAAPSLPAHQRGAVPDELARKLGYAGLLPFVCGALFVFLLSPARIGEEPFAFVVRALSSYAALIAAFLGGIPWGLVMWRGHTNVISSESLRRTLWTGIAYPLSAWIALLMPPHAGLVVMGAILVVCYLTDRKSYPELGVGGWLTLRFRLTVVASLSCFLAAAQI
jgi:hypothetical protein